MLKYLKNSWYIIIVVSILLSLVIWSALGLMGRSAEPKEYTVSVIAENLNSDRYTGFKLGLEQAARENNITINYVSSGNSMTPDSEAALVAREAASGANGIIVSVIGPPVEEAIDAVSSDTGILLIENACDNLNDLVAVTPDCELIGAQLAAAITEDYGNDLRGMTMAVISGRSGQDSCARMEKVMMDALEETGIELIWSANRPYDFSSMMTGGNLPDIIVATDETGLLTMAEYINGSDIDCGLYGIGSGASCAYYLDNGIIDTMIVPDSFTMGYQSMQILADIITGKNHDSGIVTVSHAVITHEEMYETDNEKLLFPMVQ